MTNKPKWEIEFDEEFPSPDGYDFIGTERISRIKQFFQTQIKEMVEEERQRIILGINEFSHCKKWELDETDDLYLDASIEQIKDLIKSKAKEMGTDTN